LAALAPQETAPAAVSSGRCYGVGAAAVKFVSNMLGRARPAGDRAGRRYLLALRGRGGPHALIYYTNCVV